MSTTTLLARNRLGRAADDRYMTAPPRRDVARGVALPIPPATGIIIFESRARGRAEILFQRQRICRRQASNFSRPDILGLAGAASWCRQSLEEAMWTRAWIALA